MSKPRRSHIPMLIVAKDHRILGKLFAIANTRRAANSERFFSAVAEIRKWKKVPLVSD